MPQFGRIYKQKEYVNMCMLFSFLITQNLLYIIHYTKSLSVCPCF